MVKSMARLAKVAKSLRWGAMSIIFALALILACTSQATDSPASSPPASSPDANAAGIPEAVKSPVVRPTPISQEQLDGELNRAQFEASDWPDTDFRIRTIPLDEFTGGGPGRDDIPPIDHPFFESVVEAGEWLSDNELVQVVEINGDARAYPQQVLIWHEIVNDTVGGEPVTITY
ncbi:MAG: DUF3179 domain-containing protein [SAR202 cluster bacterium]|nr:DUF3179 domain-containing protein [SAR202 cluster bacterium]